MISLNDLEWAAGFLEGEGYFSAPISPNGKKAALQIQACQVQKWPLEKLTRLFGGKIIFDNRTHCKNRSIWRWYIAGPRAAGVMMTVFSLMSPKRQGVIRGALLMWKKTET